ncbi:ParE family toxin-like protein [Vibrio sp.]|uniref:ParE family toxin-like protein n=1 Tax=Vibrio sp. TaxID=678 RepID=UPI003F6C705D
MISTKQLVDTLQTRIPLCHIKRAFTIEKQLESGTSYLRLGGRKIRSCPTFVRFKLGRGFRFIWHNTSDGLQPKAITTRQGFERVLKQIRKTSY